MRRGALLIAFLCSLAAAPQAGAAEPEWHSEQPLAPGIGVPVPLGPIGDISFWVPNRGVLISAGNQGTPAGIYAYDGTGWHLYSTVCGGHRGSVAWAGPDEFWTVSDYAEAQEGTGQPSQEWSRTLCHFRDGEVVASYGEALSSPAAYPTMNAAACAGPDDCWFAGDRLPEAAANQGAFHLHWDGTSLTDIPSRSVVEPELVPLAGSVEDLAFYQEHLYESATEAPFLDEVVPADPRRFLAVETPPTSGGPFVLATDPEQRQLWAVDRGGDVLRRGATGFETVPVEGELFPEHGYFSKVETIAAEPGAEAAWLGGGNGAAAVRRITADGSLGPVIRLPQAAEELGDKGSADQIACPAPGQCWMATSKGWLFHLGATLPEDTDPAMHRLVTFRPPDDSSRSFVPAGLPPDDSGETEPPLLPELPLRERITRPQSKRPLVFRVKQELLGKTVLQLSFTLRATARVRLLARRHKRVVASTPRLTLAKGRHHIRLRLDPARWPTSLDFQVKAASGRAGR
jgi:hypothetical protein